MAVLKIKSTNESSWSASVPATLGFRELGLHNNHIYFGNKDNVPVRLVEEADLENFSSTGGKLKGFDFGPGTGYTYTEVVDGEKTRYSVSIAATEHTCGLNQNLMINFFELDGSVYRGSEVDYTISTDGTVTIYSDDSSYTGRMLINGAVAPNAQAEWGEITGSIESQTDLINYISENISIDIPVATTTTVGGIKTTLTASPENSLGCYMNPNGGLEIQTMSGSIIGGTKVTGTTIYTHDGAWLSETFKSGSYKSINALHSSTRNYYTTSNFNTVYLWISSIDTTAPLTITIACKINNLSYSYNITPVNQSSSTTNTYHYKASSWDDIELVAGGWLIYTCKIYNGTNYFWTREVYSV